MAAWKEALRRRGPSAAVERRPSWGFGVGTCPGRPQPPRRDKIDHEVAVRSWGRAVARCLVESLASSSPKNEAASANHHRSWR